MPFILVSGPLVGYFIGHWLDGWLNTEPYLTIVMVVMGFVSSGREFYRLLKRTTDDSEKSDDDI